MARNKRSVKYKKNKAGAWIKHTYYKPETAFDTWSRYRQRIKRIQLLTSPSYLLTPKPIRRIYARTNIPTARTIVRNVIRGRSVLGRSKRCKHNASVRRSIFFKARRNGRAGPRPQKRREHKC